VQGPAPALACRQFAATEGARKLALGKRRRGAALQCADGAAVQAGLVVAFAALLAGLLGSPRLRAGQSAGPDRAPATKPSADTIEVHLAKGHEDLNHSRLQQAEREFRAALALDPHLTVRARFPLAVTLFNLQEREEARKQFEIVRAETGDDPNVNYYLGRLDLMAGSLDAAIHNLSLASAQPPFPDAAFYLGYAYLKKGNLDSSEKWLKKAAELAPRDARVHLRLGNLYRAMGRKDEAEKAFALAADLHRQDIIATEQALDCGQSLDAESLPRAREVCQNLLDPDDVGKLVSLGTLYGQHGDYADALEPFRLAVEADPDSYEMQYNLGLTYFRLKRYAEARGPLEKAVALRPDIFEVNAPLGATLYALGDDLAAYRALDQAHRLNPKNPDVSLLLFQLSMMLAKQSLEKKAPAQGREYLLRAAEIRPDDPEPHRRLAEFYESTGKQAEAHREREQAERLSSH
jgi:tetratricopeptide (TPR) repeat protein